jgi:two-component system, cell cycle response regulator DivK
MATKILLIDDAEDHLLICKYVLEHRGYEVLTVCGVDSFERLLETILSFGPDIIFTDQDMPGIQGDEVIRMVKNVSQFSHIPVIYFSGCENIEARTRQAGADGYLPKPLKIAPFLGIIAKYAGGNGGSAAV